MAAVSPLIPTGLFTFFALMSGTVSLFLPETHGSHLPDTAEQSEQVKLLPLSKVCTCRHKQSDNK